MKARLFNALVAGVLLSVPNVIFGQSAPALGTTSSFALFSAVGAFNNTGASTVTGDVGTNVGAFNAFPPGILIGQKHVADPASAAAATDVDLAYSALGATTCGTVIGVGLGNGQTLNPGVYCIGGASTLNGDLILNGLGDASRLFIFKIDGALSTGTFSNVVLTNSASLCNVYWQINGQFQLGESSVFRGTIVANGALILLEGSSLLGRGLTREGAISLHNNVVSLAQSPAASIITAGGPTTFCPGGSVILSGNAGGTWSTGETTATLTVTKGGDYFVTTTGCGGNVISNHIIVTVTPQIVCLIIGDGSVFPGQSIQLCVPSSVTSTYLWSTGATTNCITVSDAGTYSVTITSTGGCTSTCSKTVTAGASCIIEGNDTICDGQSTQLCAPFGNDTYLWSTGETSRCISVSGAGTFSVTVTKDGISSTCSKTVSASSVPCCPITGKSNLCGGQTTELCGPDGSGYTYLWSTNATLRCITISAAGTYTLTVTKNGLSSTCSKTITDEAPSCAILGSGTICEGGTTLLCAPFGNDTYLWSTGETTRCITASAAGTFSVTVTKDGCSSTCSKAVIVQALSCNITGNNTLCLGQSTQLCGPSLLGFTYMWSTGETTRCITVSDAGTFSLTLTKKGCSSTCSKTVTLSPGPTCSITSTLNPNQDGSASGPAITTLCAPAGMTSFQWSTGETTRCIDVEISGLYSVVIDSMGCISSCAVSVGDSTSGTSRVSSAGTNQGKGTIMKGNVYPNPFDSKAVIEFQNTEPNAHVVVELYSPTGNKVGTLFDGDIKQTGLYKVDVSAGDLPSGIYIYRITNGDQIITRKLWLQR